MTDYYEGVPDNWVDGLEKFSILEEDGSSVLVGPCPRCGHKIRKSLADEIGIGARLDAGGGQVRVLVRCQCRDAHEGRPEAARGCGAYGGVRLGV